jgi:cytochrome c-type biogenesis protein CcmH/NrfG
VYHYHLGTAYAKSGDASRARPALEEALRLSPNFPEASQARLTLQSLASR